MRRITIVIYSRQSTKNALIQDQNKKVEKELLEIRGYIKQVMKMDYICGFQ